VEVRAIDLNYVDCAARLIVASDRTDCQVGGSNCQVGGSELRQEEKLEVISGVVGAVAPATAVKPTSAPVAPKTILLVEPDSRMRTMMRTVLEWNGYRVVEADSPSLAMTLWPSQSKNVDLLLTAVTLPGAVSGRQLAEQLRRDKPSMKVLYTHDSSKGSDGFEQLNAQELVAKPFTSVELLESISRSIH
jgi:CheY-like chemotaxis protein